jgi:hypothetical protein
VRTTTPAATELSLKNTGDNRIQTAKLAAISATLTIGKRRGWSPLERGSIAIAYLLTSGFIRTKSPLVEVRKHEVGEVAAGDAGTRLRRD